MARCYAPPFGTGMGNTGGTRGQLGAALGGRGRAALWLNRKKIWSIPPPPLPPQPPLPGSVKQFLTGNIDLIVLM